MLIVAPKMLTITGKMVIIFEYCFKISPLRAVLWMKKEHESWSWPDHSS